MRDFGDGNHACSLPLSLTGREAKPFADWLKKFDERLAAIVEQRHGDGWESVGSSVPAPCLVQTSSNPNHAPTFLPSVKGNQGGTVVSVYDGSRKRINAKQALVKGASCAALVMIDHMFLSFKTGKLTVKVEVRQCLCDGGVAEEEECAFD